MVGSSPQTLALLAGLGVSQGGERFRKKRDQRKADRKKARNEDKKLAQRGLEIAVAEEQRANQNLSQSLQALAANFQGIANRNNANEQRRNEQEFRQGLQDDNQEFLTDRDEARALSNQVNTETRGTSSILEQQAKNQGNLQELILKAEFDGLQYVYDEPALNSLIDEVSRIQDNPGLSPAEKNRALADNVTKQSDIIMRGHVRQKETTPAEEAQKSIFQLNTLPGYEGAPSNAFVTVAPDGTLRIVQVDDPDTSTSDTDKAVAKAAEKEAKDTEKLIESIRGDIVKKEEERAKKATVLGETFVPMTPEKMADEIFKQMQVKEATDAKLESLLNPAPDLQISEPFSELPSTPTATSKAQAIAQATQQAATVDQAFENLPAEEQEPFKQAIKMLKEAESEGEKAQIRQVLDEMVAGLLQ